MPRVSVIIPVYNGESMIIETLQSVIAQTFEDFEILVIDDGSSDQTLTKVQEIQDARIKVFPYENAGVAVARNRGIQNASGEFLSFLDADDLWTPDKLEAQVNCLDVHSEAGVAYSWTKLMRNIGGSRKFHATPAVQHSGNVYAELLLTNFLHSGSNILARRSVIDKVGGFDPAPTNCEDWDFYLRLAAITDFILIPRYQIHYRQSGSALSSQVKNTQQGALLLFEKAYAQAPSKLQYLKKQSIANLYRYSADMYFSNTGKRSDVWLSLVTLLKAIRAWPTLFFQARTLRCLSKIVIALLLPMTWTENLKTKKISWTAS